MSDAKKDIKFSLKATVNKKKKRVLFAEVDGTFADVLLSFLTFPLGTIVKILKKHHEIIPQEFGSLTSLYTGLANLDSVLFWTEGAKSALLHPRSSCDAKRKRLKLDISDSPPLEYFNCPNKCRREVTLIQSMYFDSYHCKQCYGNPTMERQTQTVPCDDDEVFMKSASSFLITDDLHIVPNAGLLQIASVLGVTDLDEAETMNVTFELHEVVKLLVFSLISMNPLSVIIFNATLDCTKGTEFTANASNSNSNSKKMNLKLVVQKSLNKLLCAEAEEDFVEFLFSFLIIPLGGVEALLSHNSHVKAIDNLYKSAADLIHDKYFKNLDAKNWLMKPNITHGYISQNHIFPITEDSLGTHYTKGISLPSTNFPKGQGSYLKGPRAYMVTDDLTVTPFCVASILSSLGNQKIPVSDVEEVELQIGQKKGLSILKASLTSKCALTDALLSQVMNKEPKKEQV
ncbi:hypothetical protein AAHA92_10979 [Salvia divinorum]|uniref:DUF674 family protein n=1 Tax=Salvia divinorum TaxID=28513 RepID=A0ABD1HXD3_SALDI